MYHKILQNGKKYQNSIVIISDQSILRRQGHNTQSISSLDNYYTISVYVTVYKQYRFKINYRIYTTG